MKTRVFTKKEKENEKKIGEGREDLLKLNIRTHLFSQSLIQ